MDGEGANTLDDELQMAILLYRSYHARTSFCLTFGDTFLHNILKLLVAGCLCSKRQTIYCAPSPSALYGVDVLHIWASQKCSAAMWQLFNMAQYTKFHWARGSEAQRTEAAARHQGRSKYRLFIHQNHPYRGLSDFTLPYRGYNWDTPLI